MSVDKPMRVENKEAPSWSKLEKLRTSLTPSYPLLDPINGPTNSQAVVRLFGTNEEDVRVVLYRDNHAWCPYCHKVWLQLEEKRIPYKIIKINMRCYGPKPKSYYKLTSSGLLPAMWLDGKFYTESDRIMMLIEETFPNHTPLLPTNAREKQLAMQMFKLERNLFSAWLSWLCRPGNDLQNRENFVEVMDNVNSALDIFDGPHFLGPDLGLVDCVFAPFLERIAASILYYKGMKVRGSGQWKNIDRWFVAMEGRPTYQGTMSDYYTHVHDLPPQLGGCYKNNSPEQKAAEDAINGKDGSWSYPLPPWNIKSPEPPCRLGYQDSDQKQDSDSDQAHCVEAAAAIIRHHDKVVGLGMRAVKDKTCTENVDERLRSVVSLLLEQAQVEKKATKASVSPSKETTPVHVASALRHVRDRVGVPRDMSLPAARQLRACLNRVADGIDPDKKAGPGPVIPTEHRKDQDPTIFFKL